MIDDDRIWTVMKYLAGGLLLVMLLMLFTPAFGDNHRDCSRYGCDNDGDSVVETVIGGDDSLGIGLGLAYGMGDVDINEGQNCMGSEQKANILWGKQKLVLSPWCASLFYELNGKHTFAAKIRCDIPEIGKHYQTFDACVIGQDLSPPKHETGAQGLNRADETHELAQRQEQHAEELQSVKMQQNGLVAQLDELTALLTRARAQPEPTNAQQPAPAQYTEQEVGAFWSAFRGEGDE